MIPQNGDCSKNVRRQDIPDAAMSGTALFLEISFTWRFHRQTTTPHPHATDSVLHIERSLQQQNVRKTHPCVCDRAREKTQIGSRTPWPSD